ncbi:MAG TPA: NAD(+) synthase [Candidatus Woesebacteria bacterium]|nr:NAD(+) synthase [Candidatus Woesebacteria bacterium]
MLILTQEQATKIDCKAQKALTRYLKLYGLHDIVMGISGGIDSSVVAAIAKRTADTLSSQGYSVNLHCYFIDIESHPEDYERAKALCNALDLKLEYHDFTAWYQSCPLLETIPEGHPRARVAKGNIKCRLRMVGLMHYAQLESGIYLDTDDLSEKYMGFFTKHGDEGDVKIIQIFTKNEVYDMGEFYKLPQINLDAIPGDGLKVTDSNKASDQLGLPYLKGDYIICRLKQLGFKTEGGFNQLENKLYRYQIKIVASEIGETEEKVEKILRQALKTAFKRRYGDNVCSVLNSRRRLGLPEIDTIEFGKLYLEAIKKLPK